MLFNRLVEAIESHSDDIVTSLVAQIMVTRTWCSGVRRSGAPPDPRT